MNGENSDDLDDIDSEMSSEHSEDEEVESNQVFVTFETKEILGVTARVVRDVEWEEGLLVEDTFDWYAQDTEGNVWYLGEFSTGYDYDDEGNFLGTNNDGSWEAGVDGALPGFIMEANPQIGDNYYQEFFVGVAEDEAEVVSLDESVSIELDDFENVLQTREFTELEPDVFEFKYYAPGVGQILAEEGITEPGDPPELSPELDEISTFAEATLPALTATTFESSADVDNPFFPLEPGTIYIYEGSEVDDDTGETEQERDVVFVTDETKDILGITTRVVQEVEFENGQLTEEDLAYYAQDTDGNVWLLGESSTEYEYDDEGNLLEVEKESWQAGVDEILPGFIVVGDPQVGDAYYQEFELGDDEDQAEVVSLNESVSTPIGQFDNVLQIQEFSDLDPEGSDLSYYAPSLGLVWEQEFDEDGDLESTSVLIETRENANSIEDGFAPPERVLGTAQNDVFNARNTPGFDGIRKLFLTGDGNDLVDLSGPNSDIRSMNLGNRVNSGNGRDELIAGRGDILFGNRGDDILDGTQGAGRNRMFGGAGNDDFLLGSGDRASGGQGDDRFFVISGGDNVITGRMGADQFWIANGQLPETANTITDFESGTDLLGMSGLGVSFDDLTLTQRNANTIISVSGEEVAILQGIQASGLSESNFIFA